MDDQIVFLGFRLDEDEALARRNSDGHGLADGFPDYRTYIDEDTAAADDYIRNFSPDRMLREVEAGRRILARYEDCLARMEDPDYPHAVARDQAREYEDFVLPNLLTRWSSHPDYRQEWAP